MVTVMNLSWETSCGTDDPIWAAKIRERGLCNYQAIYTDPMCLKPAAFEYSAPGGYMFICCQDHADDWDKVSGQMQPYHWTKKDLGGPKSCSCSMHTLMSTGCRCGGI